MKLTLIPVFLLLTTGCHTGSADPEEITNPDPGWTISGHLEPGTFIHTLAATDGNNYIFTSGTRVTIVEASQPKNYQAASEVLAMAVDPADGSLWLGTSASGLAHLHSAQFRYFSAESHGLPRNCVSDVAVTPRGAVWFSSSAHKLGGLCCLENGQVSLFTPENSLLPDNLVKSIALCGELVFVVTGGTVDQQKVVQISGGNWSSLPVQGYYLMAAQADKKGTLYVIDDVSLSSSMAMNPKIWKFNGTGAVNILPLLDRFQYTPAGLITDHRNYLWVSGFAGETSKTLMVYDGEKWHEGPADFPELVIRSLAVDRSNTLWLGTDNGIYLLKQ